MNYELAKELKEAGFPGSDTWLYVEEGSKLIPGPSLSELIEACGVRQLALLQEIVNGGLEYIAIAYTPETKQATGSTPEEAVAACWLSLNKK